MYIINENSLLLFQKKKYCLGNIISEISKLTLFSSSLIASSKKYIQSRVSRAYFDSVGYLLIYT